MIDKQVFNESGYTVRLVKRPKVGIEWIISDGTYSFSVPEEPILDLKCLQKEMSEYVSMRLDGLDEQDIDRSKISI